jgi:hypothetical protein
MTTAIFVAAVLGFSYALGSLIRQVDGATLRRWRLYRRWDVSRLAREFIAAADEPLANLRGLMHMINAWERGVRRPSERYWLLYLRVFPECANGETAFNAIEAADFSSAHGEDHGEDQGDIRALAATVRALEQQVAGLSRRLDELSGNEHDAARPGEKSRTSSRYRRPGWAPLWTTLIPSLAP